MALDHGPQGIRVNCICPGDTDTAMLRQEAAQLGEPVDRFLADSAQRPLAGSDFPKRLPRQRSTWPATPRRSSPVLPWL